MKRQCNRKRPLCFTLLAALMASATLSGSGKTTILPRDSYFKTIMLDPTACQLFGSTLGYSRKGYHENKAYVPVTIGMKRTVIRWEQGPAQGFEFGFGIASYTLFFLEDMGAAFRATLLNTDYKIEGFINLISGERGTRLRVFHVSSHLGDEYLIRNKITQSTPNTVNYEQVDLTHSIQRNFTRYYFGAGFVVTPHAMRKRISLQGGFFHQRPMPERPLVKYLYGVDVKIFEQNSYRPNIKLGVGLEIGDQTSNPFRIVLEYYNGHLPYSTLEYEIVQMLGLGLYFNALL